MIKLSLRLCCERGHKTFSFQELVVVEVLINISILNFELLGEGMQRQKLGCDYILTIE